MSGKKGMIRHSEKIKGQVRKESSARVKPKRHQSQVWNQPLCDAELVWSETRDKATAGGAFTQWPREKNEDNRGL